MQTSDYASMIRRLIQVSAIAACLLTLIAAVLLAETPKPGLMFGLYPYKPFALLSGLAYPTLWACYVVFGRQSLNYGLARFVLSTVALALAFGVFELGAASRLVDYRTVFGSSAHGINKFDPFRDPTWQIDPDLIHIRRPNTVIEGTTIGNLASSLPNPHPYPVDATYDGRGFRNERTLDRANVVLIGDSFVEAGLVATPLIASNRLADLLNTAVVNLGQCAYGPQQELIVLRRYAMPLRPEVVAWFFFEGNDLSNIRQYEDKIKSWAQTVNAHDGFSQRCFTKNLFFKLSELTGPLVAGAISGTNSASPGELKIGTKSTETLHFLYSGAPLTESDHRSLTIAQALLQQAREAASDGNGHFVLVFVPTKFRVYEGLCSFPDDDDACDWHVNDLPDRLATWCREQEMNFLDLTPALRDAAERGDLVYFPDDTHWSARGNEVAAEAVAQFIQHQRWLTTGVLPSSFNGFDNDTAVIDAR